MVGRIATCLVVTVIVAGCGNRGMHEYQSLDGRYRVILSGTPKVEVRTFPTAVGPMVSKITSAKDLSETARLIMYVDYPPPLLNIGNREAFLDNYCLGWAHRTRVSVLSKAPIEIAGHSGRDLTFDSLPNSQFGKVSGRAWFFVVGARLYVVTIMAPPGRLDAATIDSFFNSFALLDQGPGPPQPVPNPDMPGSPPPQLATDSDNPPHQPAATLAFYDVPDPADAPIEADIPGMGSKPAASRDAGLDGAPKSTIPGATIRSFEWVDANADMVGTFDNNSRADGKRDHHFRLQIDLPPTTIIESMALSTDNVNRWETRPTRQWWPLAVFQNGRAVCRAQVPQLGLFEGSQTFDLYVNTRIGPRPGDPARLEVAISAGGGQSRLTAKCQVPSTAPEPGQLTRPAPAIAAAPPTSTAPAASPVGPAGRPKVVGQLLDRPAKGNPASGRESTAVPVVANPTSGGATIVAFDWLDQDQDRVGTSGRTIAPSGDRDEHFQLVLDVPGASTIEAININGNGVLRWTTKTGFRTWPVAVVVNQQPRNRAQVYRLGAFSGRWTFDLYVESHDTVKPHQPFGVEVIFTSRGIKHTLTARCERKK